MFWPIAWFSKKKEETIQRTWPELVILCQSFKIFKNPELNISIEKFQRLETSCPLILKIFQDPEPEVIKINEQPKGVFFQFCGFKSLKNIFKRFQNGHSVKNAQKEIQDPTRINTKNPKFCRVTIKHYKY